MDDKLPRLFSTSGIKRDVNRFHKIVRGKVRKNLKKYINQGEMLVPKDGKHVSIPVPQIDLPRFIFGDQNQNGVGQGEGKPGDPIDGKDGAKGQASGQGEAGNQSAEHSLDVDVSIEELADMLGEELELPNIDPKGTRLIEAYNKKYKDIHTIGPQSLRHFKRTFKEALKRQIASGVYDPDNPVIVPIKEDFRYRGWDEVPVPQTNAVILYIMDVSGSMGQEQKDIVRTESFWIDTWLTRQYKGVERRYIIHDASAKEVNEDTFYKTRESGGTLISSAYKLAIEILEKDFPVYDWNAYVFHFSDGDNWSGEDTSLCLQLLNQKMLPRLNQFSYGQVDSRYGSGQFFKDLMESYKEEDRVVISRIPDREGIYESIKTFLGTGK